MAHILYGYKVVNGKVTIDEIKAEQVRTLFKGYLDGLSLASAAKDAGIHKFHGPISKMLVNERYLGDDVYLQIIDQQTFEQVKIEKLKRAELFGRVKDKKIEEPITHQFIYTMKLPSQVFDDPFAQAEYAYTLIESEEVVYG